VGYLNIVQRNIHQFFVQLVNYRLELVLVLLEKNAELLRAIFAPDGGTHATYKASVSSAKFGKFVIFPLLRILARNILGNTRLVRPASVLVVSLTHGYNFGVAIVLGPFSDDFVVGIGVEIAWVIYDAGCV